MVEFNNEANQSQGEYIFGEGNQYVNTRKF